MGIRAKFEWRRLKAEQRAGQAMIVTGCAVVPAVAGYARIDFGACLFFTVLGLGLAAAGWVVARHASSRMAREVRPRDPTPAR